MAIIDLFIAIGGIFLGGFLDYKYRDKVLAWYHTADGYAKILETKASALKAAVK